MSNRILLVEDDPINVKFIQTVLIKKGGFEVIVSEEVDEILRVAQGGDLAAIIMDVSLSRSSYEGKKVDGIFITQLGRRFVRNLVQPFDAYLAGLSAKTAFSRTV